MHYPCWPSAAQCLKHLSVLKEAFLSRRTSASLHKKHCNRDPAMWKECSELPSPPSLPHTLSSPYPWPLPLLYIYHVTSISLIAQHTISFLQLLSLLLFHSKLSLTVTMPMQSQQVSHRNRILLWKATAHGPTGAPWAGIIFFFL